jgi:hypothetical protein
MNLINSLSVQKVGISHWTWSGPQESLVFEPEAMQHAVQQLTRPIFAVEVEGRVGITHEGEIQPTIPSPFGRGNGEGSFPPPGIQNGEEKTLTLPSPKGRGNSLPALALSWPVGLEQLGDPAFCRAHGTRYAYSSGAMAQGISSAELVIALGQAGLLGSFGAAGMAPARLETMIQKI